MLELEQYEVPLRYGTEREDYLIKPEEKEYALRRFKAH
jgi:hypothetical protein